MPIEIVNSKDDVVEVRLFCDNCKVYIGNRIMKRKEVQVQKPTLCVKCKKTGNIKQ